MSGVDLFSGAPCRHRGCQASRFYTENGLTYCRRGHLQEGAVQQAADDGFIAGPQGTTTRIERAPKVKQRRTLPESSAQRLYFQSFQVILQKQLYVLINEFGFPPAFEDLVLQLWRIKLHGASLEKSTVGERNQDGDELVFSSQAFDDNLTNGSKGQYKRELSILIGSGRLPRGSDTLAILYLAAILLSIPWTVKELIILVELDILPLIRLNEIIPHEMYQRLPSAMLMRLDCSRMTGEDVLRQIYGLRLNLYSSCAFEVPAPTFKHLAIKLLSSLLLPVSTLPAVLELASRYDRSLETEIHENHSWWKSSPELCLLASIVIVVRAKLRGAFDTDPGTPGRHSFSWEKWSLALRQLDQENVMNSNARHRKFGGRQELCALTMTDTEMDEYMDWYSENMAMEDHGGKRRGSTLPKDIFALFSTTAGKQVISQDGAMPTLQHHHDSRSAARQELQSTTSRSNKKPSPLKKKERPELEKLLLDCVAAQGAITSSLLAFAVQFWGTKL